MARKEELNTEEQTDLNQQGADALAEAAEFSDPDPMDEETKEIMSDVTPEQTESPAKEEDLVAVPCFPISLDDEQFLVRYTLSDGRIRRQFVSSDEEASAWASTYRVAAERKGLELSSATKA